MEVLLDGKLLPATFVKFEVKAKKIAKVVVELVADIEVEGYVHQIGRYEPVKIDKSTT